MQSRDIFIDNSDNKDGPEGFIDTIKSAMVLMKDYSLI